MKTGVSRGVTQWRKGVTQWRKGVTQWRKGVTQWRAAEKKSSIQANLQT